MFNALKARIKPHAYKLVSAIILSFILLQAAATFEIIQVFAYKDRLWPFLDYPMYNEAFRKGETIDRFLLYGIKSDSTEIRILPEDLGLSFWQFRSGLVVAINNSEYENLHVYIDLATRKKDENLIGFSLKNRPMEITEKPTIEGDIVPVKKIYFKDFAGKE